MVTLAAAGLTGLTVALAVGTVTGSLPELRRRMPRRRQVSRQQEWLTQAGVRLSPRRFVAGSVLVGAAAFGLIVLATGTPAVGLIPAVSVGLLPRAYLARRRAARLREVQEAWPDGLRELVAAISAGMSLHRALLLLAETGPEPLRGALSRYPLGARVLGVPAALELVREDLADPTSDRIIEVLIVAYERGGAIVPELLRDLADATVRDTRATEEITTEALEQRINARVVFVLPWAVLLLLCAQPGHFRDFYGSPGGLAVVALGALLSSVGIWLVTRLGREPVEERVLGGASDPGTGATDGLRAPPASLR
jgi:tight adherence protein B